MKKLQIIASVFTLILLGILISLILREDRTGPVITFANTDIKYAVGEPEEVLIKNVSAFDEADGDVSDSVMIAGILPMLDGSTAKVTYVAKDLSDNVSVQNLIIPYSNGGMENEEGEVNPAADDNSGDSGFVQEANTYPYIALTTHKVELGRGADFDALSYVAEVYDDKNNADEMRNRIRVLGDYDMDQTGDYILLYYVVDLDNNESNKEYLWIKVN